MSVLAAALLMGAAVLVWPGARRPAVRRDAMARPWARSLVRHSGHRGVRPVTALPTVPVVPAPPPLPPPLPATVVMELVAAALLAGLPGPAAVAAAAAAAGPRTEALLAPVVGAWQLGLPAATAWADVDAAFVPLARSLVLAERTGASAAVVLRHAAADARAARQRRARVAARRLGVQLVLPLGLTTLPAFVLWGVAPVVLGLATQLLDTT